MKLDHLGVAVESLEAARQAYQALGLDVVHQEWVEKDQVTVAFVPFNGGRFELLEASSPESPVGRFLSKNGPGLHHVALEVEDIHQYVASLAERGVRMIDQEPRPGAEGTLVAFVHPSSAGGVLIELVERPEVRHV